MNPFGDIDCAARIVISACMAQAASSMDSGAGTAAERTSVRPNGSEAWLPERLASLVEAAVGRHASRSLMPAMLADEARYVCKRRSSAWMCRSIEQVLRESRLSSARARAAMGIANCLAYSYFSNDERINPFQLKTNIEQHTPASIGDQFGFHGPHLLAKEGDNADLVALDCLVTSFEAFAGPMVLCGVAEPHHLLTCLELLWEQKRLEKQIGGTITSGAVSHYSEGVAALVLETQTSATARGCQPALAVGTTFGCLRNLDYGNPASLRGYLESSMRRLVGRRSRGPKVVFACFRNNRCLVEAEAEAIRAVFPRATVVNASARLGNCSVVSGLLDISTAADLVATSRASREAEVTSATGEHVGIALEPGDGIIVHKISKLGQYAGVWLDVL